MSDNVTQSRDERAELLVLQEQMLEQMSRQNDNREREVAAIEAKTKKDIEWIGVEKSRIAEMARKSSLEERQLNTTAALVQKVTIVLELIQSFISKKFPVHDNLVIEQNQLLRMLLELMKIIVPQLLKESSGDAEVSRLADILKSFVSKGDINITPGDVNVGTQFRGNVTAGKDVDITSAEGKSKISK